MRFLFTVFIAIIAFAAGIWYMGGFEEVPAMPEVPRDIGSNNAANTSPAATTTTPQATYRNADATRIRVASPLPGARVPSTFSVSGEAVGGWYFEANFPYEVLDANGTRLVQGPVQAQGEWMTPEFVPFSFRVTVPNYTGPAMLVLHNDNPSGLPENAASISIPITIE